MDITIPTGETIREIVREEVRSGIAEMLEKKEREKVYFTREQTAHRLNITLPTLNHYTKTGLIKSYRFGRRVLYTGEDIEKSIQTLSK